MLEADDSQDKLKRLSKLTKQLKQGVPEGAKKASGPVDISHLDEENLFGADSDKSDGESQEE